ncbi:MAG: response regulator transcription factor [Planctomycetota bacterium]
MHGLRRIILADDHNLVRSGLAALLNQEARYKVVAEATDGIDAVDRAADVDAELLIVDLAMPRLGGMEVIRRIRETKRSLRILVLSMYDDVQFVSQAISAGANGYLVKHAMDDELFEAIEQVMAGHSYISSSIDPESLRECQWADADLTPRECEVLHLIAEGLTNSAIARELQISPNTVTRHRANLMQKLHVHNRVELIQTAAQHGLITLLPTKR